MRLCRSNIHVHMAVTYEKTKSTSADRAGVAPSSEMGVVTGVGLRPRLGTSIFSNWFTASLRCSGGRKGWSGSDCHEQLQVRMMKQILKCLEDFN